MLFVFEVKMEVLITGVLLLNCKGNNKILKSYKINRIYVIFLKKPQRRHFECV